MNDPKQLTLHGQRPTRVRYSVLFLLCVLAMITYIDRAVIGSSKDSIMAAVGRSADDFFYLLVAFQLAYALFEVPTGWMGDTFGPRATLLRIVMWWSFFIALTGLAGKIEGFETVFIGFTLLIVVQFLFGMGEAGAFPNITRALYNWFPATQRGFAQGAIWLSARFMGGLTPLLWLLLTYFAGFSWRQGFLLFAGLAVLWCLVFWWWFRNHPEQHSVTNQAERDLIAAGKKAGEISHSGVPWGTLIRSRNLRNICLMYFCANYGWYFFMYFLPGFMKEQFGPERPVNAAAIVIGAPVHAVKPPSDSDRIILALLTGGPLLLGMPGCLIGGMLSDRYVRRTGDRKWGRRLYGMIGFGMASICYLGAVFAFNRAGPFAGLGDEGALWAFAGLIAAAGFFNDLTMGSCWATCQDVGRRYAAIVAGCMNMIGNLGGVLTNLVTGQVLKSYAEAGDKFTGYTICLSLYATAFALGVFFWTQIDATKPVVPEEPDQETASVPS